jgi:hypothetical protein
MLEISGFLDSLSATLFYFSYKSLIGVANFDPFSGYGAKV